jgi:hypothetical protein
MILVTGATGKVGRHLVDGLLAAGAEVRALTRDPAAAQLPAGAEVMRGDPGQPETIAAALTGATKVFVNVTAVGGSITELMAAAARAGVRSVVLLSSLAIRDNGAQPYSIGAHHKAIEDGPPRCRRTSPRSPACAGRPSPTGQPGTRRRSAESFHGNGRPLGDGRSRQRWIVRWRSLAGSATRSSSAIRPPDTVKLRTAMGLSPVPNSRPTAPLTMAGRAAATNRGAVSST